MVLQSGEPPSVQLLCLPLLSSTALLLGSVSAILDPCSEQGSFTSSSAGAHVRSTQLVCVPRRVMWVLSSRITAHGPRPPQPRPSCPVSLCPIYQHIQPPPLRTMLWVTCHHFVKQTGHLGREAAAVLLPGVSGICSLHAHTHTHTEAAFT